jgi:hypothetical protein
VAIVGAIDPSHWALVVLRGGSMVAAMSLEPTRGWSPVHDRAFLLSERKRNHFLELWEVQQYGRDSFGDPGLRLPLRTPPGIMVWARRPDPGPYAVECTRDQLAELIGSDLAAVARPAITMACCSVPVAGHPDSSTRKSRQAVGAADRRSRAFIGLAVPGRPIGPWSRRTGAPEASATGRDRSPPVHGGYTRSRQVGGCNGHQRSPREQRYRRSDRQLGRDQVAL